MLTKLLGNPWVLGGIGAVFMLLVGAVGWYAWDAQVERARADAAVVEQKRIQSQLDLAITVNKDNVRALEEIERKAQRDAALVTELQDQLDAASGTALALAEKIAALRKGNPDVESFYRLSIPDPLRCLYGNAQACARSPRPD